MRDPFWTSHNGETTLTLYQGHVLDVLREMPAESVHCVVTSPPYWGLRDYGTATWDGGDPECDHKGKPGGHLKDSAVSTRGGGLKMGEAQTIPWRDACGKCGARRIDVQIGLESTPEEYIAKTVEVFREVKRVLRKDGTLWLNLGSGYANGVIESDEYVLREDLTEEERAYVLKELAQELPQVWRRDAPAERDVSGVLLGEDRTAAELRREDV